MDISRHTFNPEYSERESGEHEIARVPRSVESAFTGSDMLFRLMDRGHRAASYGIVAGVEWDRVKPPFAIAARAAAAMFAAGKASPSNPVTVRLVPGGSPVTYVGTPDESTLNISRWIEGFHLGQVAGDEEALDLLCQTDPSTLRGSSTTGAEYLYLYARALHDYRLRRWQKIVDTMLAAVRATDPTRSDISDSEWALFLHVPELETLIYVVTKDPKFSDSLRRAVEKHKKYWAKKKDYRMNDPLGFVSVPLTSLARMGLQNGLSVDFESDYIPRELLG